jgi:hypothetical protein
VRISTLRYANPRRREPFQTGCYMYIHTYMQVRARVGSQRFKALSIRGEREAHVTGGLQRERIHGEPCAPMQDCCCTASKEPRCRWVMSLVGSVGAAQKGTSPRRGQHGRGCLIRGFLCSGAQPCLGRLVGCSGVMEMQPRWEWLALREHAVTGPKGEKQLHEEDTMKPLRPL